MHQRQRMESSKSSWTRTLARFKASIPVCLALMLSPVKANARAQASDDAQNRKLEVVIISVENFDDPYYYNPLLQLNIHNAADQLIEFFSRRFPSAHLTVLRTHDDTTSPHLSEFFRGTFRNLASGNMVLLFVISHGEALPNPNPAYGSELRIVASNTPFNDIPGKTLSLTTDIIGNLGGLLPGSFLFGFIDTCHAGAAKNLQLAIEASLISELGVKTMLMASSLSDQLAFQASFSQALVKIWSGPQRSPQASTQTCTAPEASTQLVRSTIQGILGPSSPLGRTEGFPTVLLHFQGQMCLETFNAQSAIVDIVNGSPNTYVASFTDQTGDEFDQPVNGNEAVPIRLSRTTYHFAVYRNNREVAKPKDVDLANSTFDWEVIGAPDAHQIATALENGASAAESVGADARDVLSTRRLAYSAYVMANDRDNAERVALAIGPEVGPEWNEKRVLALQSTDEIRKALVKSDDPIALGRAAEQLQTYGNLKAAGELFAEAAAAAKQTSSTESSALAADAYLALSASGEYEKAKSVRARYDVPLNEICASCRKLEGKAVKGDVDTGRTLENLTTVKVLSNLSQQDKAR